MFRRSDYIKKNTQYGIEKNNNVIYCNKIQKRLIH